MTSMHPLAPTDAQIIAAVKEHGSLRRASTALGYWQGWVRDRIRKDKTLAGAVAAVLEKHPDERHRVSVKEDEAVLVYSTDKPALGDIGQLIRECGLDPDEWVVVSMTLNKWEGMTAPQLDESGEKRNQKMPLNQWKVALRRTPRLILAAPAVYMPPVERPKWRPTLDRPELIVVEGDHQVPYHDTGLHIASLYALEDMFAKHNLRRHVFLGDTGDYPTISAHRDHPTAMAAVNEVIQGVCNLLRDKREAAPVERCELLDGNHDWRLESELLGRAERMYGIKPASLNGEEELPALDLCRLLHLDKLGVERISDQRGWQHGEIELVGGLGGLVVRHGWLTSANSAAASLKKRGRSIIVGHTHRPEHHFMWDPSAGMMREAVTAGAMCARTAHFVTLDAWLQGFVTVSVWPSGHFSIEHAMWDGKTLHWRDRSYSP